MDEAKFSEHMTCTTSTNRNSQSVQSDVTTTAVSQTTKWIEVGIR